MASEIIRPCTSVPSAAYRRLAAWLCAVFLAGGCASDAQIRGAIDEVNAAFRTRYEEILKTKGTRRVNADRDRAWLAMRRALASLGMQVESEDAGLGYMRVFAPAPRPLNQEEWRRAVDADLPLMRDLARKHVGALAEFLNFEPEQFQILIHVTVVEVKDGSQIALTMRMREIDQNRARKYPPREYAPPTAVVIGLDKIWAAFDRELPRTEVR